MIESTQLVRDKIYEAGANGRFFSVDFVRRTDGNVRHMTCRLGVKKYITGRELAFDPGVKDLVNVWDSVKRGYRFISLEGVIQIKGRGRTMYFNPRIAEIKLEREDRSDEIPL